jgi:hypothetical protein
LPGTSDLNRERPDDIAGGRAPEARQLDHDMIRDIELRRQTVKEHCLADAPLARDDREADAGAQTVEQGLMVPAKLRIEIREPGVRRNPEGFLPNSKRVADHYVVLTAPFPSNQPIGEFRRANRQMIWRRRSDSASSGRRFACCIRQAQFNSYYIDHWNANFLK